MKPRSLDEIRTEMNQRYGKGLGAYEKELPFDRLRTEEIFNAVLELATDRLRDDALQELRTLDVGSGIGGIAEYWPHRNIVGVEISEVAVAQARQRFPDVRYECSAIEDWKSDEKFPLVVAVETIEHWSDVNQGLDAIRACMPENGVFVLTTPNRDSLHCRIGKKLKLEVPFCSRDHTKEFGFEELIDTVRRRGFLLSASRGVHLAPYWALEAQLGVSIRSLTDKDDEVNGWLNEIGRDMPPKYAFIQAHRFVAV